MFELSLVPEISISEDILSSVYPLLTVIPTKTHLVKTVLPRTDIQTATAPNSVLGKSCGFHQSHRHSLVNTDMPIVNLTYIHHFVVGTTIYADVILATQH